MVCERLYTRPSEDDGDGRKERRGRSGDAAAGEGGRQEEEVARGGERERPNREVGGGWKGYEGAAGSAALIKLAEDNEPVCRLACLAV